MAEWLYYKLVAERFLTNKFCSRFYSIEIEFYSKNRVLSHPFGDLVVMPALHLSLVGKPVVNFLFAIIELFRYLLWLRRYKRKSVEVGVFRRGGSL